MSERVELLPCPFCGAAAQYDQSSDCAGGPWVLCRGCSAHVLGGTKGGAIAAWNRRATTSEGERG